MNLEFHVIFTYYKILFKTASPTISKCKKPLNKDKQQTGLCSQTIICRLLQ